MGFSNLYLQELQGLKGAEVGTNATTIVITEHGLQTGDMITNTTRTLDGKIYQSSYVIRVDDNTLTTRSIPGQTTSDAIVLFSFVDRTQYLKSGSLNISRNINLRNFCSGVFCFDLVPSVDPAFLFFPRTGQIIKIVDGAITVFAGPIQLANIRRIGNSQSSKVNIDFQSSGYNTVPQRRTVEDEFFDTTAKVIVEFQVDNYLSAEGITKGTIETGADIDEYPQSGLDGKNIKEILDDMAEISGCVWYIDQNRALHFITLDTITDAPETLEDAGTFKDFWDVEVVQSLEDYRNKQFVKGGIDDDGDLIFVGSTDYDEVNERQLLEGGTGVYGNVLENNNLTFAERYTADTGTNTTTIVTTVAHGLLAGDVIVNMTRNNAKREVLTVTNTTTFTVASVTDQAAGDIIKTYPDANVIMRQMLRTYGGGKTLTFTTSNLDFAPLQKLIVDLAQVGIENEEYLIEEVNIIDINGKHLRANVIASLRDFTNASSRPIEGWEEYFRRLIFREDERDLRFLTEMKIYDNGMVLDFKDGRTADYDFTLDGDGNITQIKNNTTGVTADIDDIGGVKP